MYKYNYDSSAAVICPFHYKNEVLMSSGHWDWQEGVAEVVAFITATIATAALCVGCLFIAPAKQKADARKVWHNTTATVVQVSGLKGTSVDGSYRTANLSFRDFYGRDQLKRNVRMHHATRLNDREKVVVNKDGRTWIENNLDERGSNPRHPPPYSWFIVLTIVIPGLCFIITLILSLFVTWGLLAAATAIVLGVKHILRKSLLVRFAHQRIKRALGRACDGIKLRWEFYRRRKQIRPSPAYKAVRRFQAELARMDPTPSVIAARRKANELLTRVLERDNERVEVIDGLIEQYREDIDDDLRTRQEAREEIQSM